MKLVVNNRIKNSVTQSNYDELFIIPCCASKASGGVLVDSPPDQLQQFVSTKTYFDVISTRTKVLGAIYADTRFTTGKYLKNEGIHTGSDFGQQSSQGKYLAAIERYTGTLYTSAPSFTEIVKESLVHPSSPRLLILSALYGPLHPLTMIQDYNLKMSDKPAFQQWKSQFPVFLKNYMHKSGIRKIRLYLGGSTAYLKVARAAIQTLKTNQLVEQVTQYDVKEGGTYMTPFVHGQLVALHLLGQRNAALENKVVARVL